MKRENKIAKINKENLVSKKAGISYFQILILVIASFAFSYLVYESSKEINKVYEEKKKETSKLLDKDGNFDSAQKSKFVKISDIHKLEQVKKEAKTNLLVSLVSNFFSGWMKRSKLNLVSAAENNVSYGGFAGFGSVNLGSLSLQCCPKLKSGASCQDLASSSCSQDCAVSCLPTKCELTSVCKLGCCYDSSEGICSNNAPKGSCEQQGKWFDDKACNIGQCKYGCCVLGSETSFVTAKRCSKLADFYGLSTDFRANIKTEIECIALSYAQEEGACIIEEKNDIEEIERNCKFTSKEECVKISGSINNFYQGKLCTNSGLNTTCEKTSKTSCIDSEDEVYFQDSCGNRANIYDSSKVNDDSYWQNIVKKENSCILGKGNPKTCGNCNYFLGSICGVGKADVGNYICKDLNCKNAVDVVDAFGKVLVKKDRKNGESWCVYDSYIGEGKDVVGSRHYKYYCIDGQVRSEPCGDFRTGICVESEIDLTSGKGKFSNAACRPNRAMECLSYNTDEDKSDTELREDCEENSDCEIRALNFGKGYKFEVCAAKYPPGFDLNAADGGEAAEQICNVADFTCTKVKVKKLSGWKCVSGCDCDSIKFTQQMNDWCVSLGDCGGYVNIAGEVTDDGYSISKAPEISLEQYKKYAVPISGQKAEPGNFSELLASYYGWGAATDETYEKDVAKAQEEILMNIVGTGGIAEVLGGGPAYLVYLIPPFAALGIIISISASIGLIITKITGITDPTMAVAIGAGIFIAVILVIFISLGWALGIGIVVGVIVYAIFSAFGIGKIKKTKVVFNCEPWQPPSGGADCKKCTEGGSLNPCTKYKCSSLGQTCELINEGTGNEICLDSNPNDVTAPKINPWYSLISPGFKYDGVSDDGFKLIGNNGECLTEFTPVIFGISTKEEPSQCKYDVVHTTGYENMEFYFGESSLYKYNHMMVLNMPSVESLLANLSDELNETEIANLKNIAINKFGNLTFYVRCIDKAGNSNLKEYLIRTCVKAGPDLTPPYVTKTEPSDGSYLAYNLNSTNLKIWTNEPATCKYGLNDLTYDLINKSFSCDTDLEDVDLYGWKCNTVLENLNKGENKFYIKCKDQPWLPEENKSRNSMSTSYILTLKKSESELKITKIEPNATMMFGVEPATVILRVKTEGGAENGKSTCGWSFTSLQDVADDFSQYDSEHNYKLNQMLRGSYNLYINCKDIAGNVAEGQTKFTVKIDKSPPQIIRVYNEDEEALKIITDEDAECVYDFNSCRYIWENATEMTGILREHTADWKQGKTYYVKCEDLWENKPDACSIIVKAV